MAISLLGIIIIFGIVTIAVAETIYLFRYKRRINQRLNSAWDLEDRVTKPMISPLKFVLILLLIFWAIITLLIVIATIVYSVNTSSGTSQSDIDTVSVQEYDTETVNDTMLANFSPDEEIKGYLRFVKTDGNFKFVCYKSLDIEERTFPQLLIYAEYTGDTEYYESGYDILFENSDTYSGKGAGGCSAGGKWFVASIDESVNHPDGNLEISCYMLTKASAEAQLKAENDTADYGSFADETGSILLSLEEIFDY